ncbi:group I intron-associated PD-(D/E)XK endonuclease [Halorubrum sp. AD140]|uniref:group I intron-associated PD-(D/E)XK endonuclease n=1 Tax=Halorubrum sp. AD140 TaxID=3050073 RepID=UPI002ACC4057|nr:group I intron-associated PD-(D/E)XK endonuclease [Halorubrum sp. AD140]MDZ5812124.1 group I intron-associated PD-(D/E)XK endonuclease [Halorubrum sp. AD140]
MSERSERFASLEEPQKRGQAAEAIVKSECVSYGISVLVPAYDNESYDLVADIDDDFYRIQIKTAFEATTDGAVRFRTRSTRTKSSGYEREGYEGSIDLFAVYAPVCDETYLIPIEDASKTQMTVRYERSKNNNVKNINWHEDYLFDEVLPSLGSNPTT